MPNSTESILAKPILAKPIVGSERSRRGVMTAGMFLADMAWAG